MSDLSLKGIHPRAYAEQRAPSRSCGLTFGDLGPLLVEGVVELVVLALQRVDLLVELGLDLGRLELQLLERLQPALHGCGQ